MRNLLFFLSKYYTFILFFFLEGFSIVLLFRYNNYQHASFLNYTGNVSSKVYEIINGTSNYFNLRSVNDSLLNENARLRAQLLNAYYEDNVVGKQVIDTAYHQQYSYLPANVVNNSVTKRNNFITIDKGSKHGIKKDMGVINSNGIVGIVTEVSEHFSTIRSALNRNTKISCMLKKNKAFGSLEWPGLNPRISSLKDINKHIEIAINDEVVTSNFSSIFPEGIPVGRIISSHVEPDGNFYQLAIELHTDFTTLKNVYVVNNLLKDEQQNLEANNKNDN